MSSRNELGIPAIVQYELEYQTLRSSLPDKRRRELELGLGHLRSVPFNGNAALAAANIRVNLEKQGLAIGPLDLMIAGTALSLGALLVTNNMGEFSRVAGLRLADWRLP